MVKFVKFTQKTELSMLFAPIISMFIFTIGNGFFTTLTTIQLKRFDSPAWMIGIISAAFFTGLLIASYHAQKFIIRVGHIRAYAVFASLIAVCSTLQGLLHNDLVWFVLRFVCGYCLAGLFIIIESWCLDGSEFSHKGRIFAIYMFSYYFAQAMGQLLLKVHFDFVLTPFCIIAGIVSFSVIPVCVTKFTAPKLELPMELSPLLYLKKVPLGAIGSIVAGLVLSSIYAILPLVLSDLRFSATYIAYLMSVTILGGTVFQLPIGKLSDHTDRRLILLLSGLIVFVSSFIFLFIHNTYWIVFIILFIMGGGAFVIYPLSISHATDYIQKSDTIAVLSAMSLFYGLGSSVGPIITSNLVKMFGPLSLFVAVGVVCLALIVYTVVRMVIRVSATESERSHFVAATQEVVIGAEHALEEELNR